MPTVIRVPTLIIFLENSHAYGNKGVYAYSEVKSMWTPQRQKNLKIAELGLKFKNPISAIYIASRTIDYMHAMQGKLLFTLLEYSYLSTLK